MRSHPAQSSRMRPLFSWQPVKELSIAWISAVRPSRQPLRGFLRMRSFLNVINQVPHAEERPPGCVSKHAPHPSSRYARASSILSQALGVRDFFNNINDSPYAEEPPAGASRSTHGRDAADFLTASKARIQRLRRAVAPPPLGAP